MNDKRIVSMSPAATETLFMLGLDDSIIGVSAFCLRPEQAKLKRKVGSFTSYSQSIMDDLKPDIIFTVAGIQDKIARKLSEKYNVIGIKMPESVNGILENIDTIAASTDTETEAEDLKRMLYQNITPNKNGMEFTGYVEMDMNGPISSGSSSYINDAL
ncbi:MAG: ABC transporter substrate-binding protein, partial [Thermoplasmata archaeon]